MTTYTRDDISRVDEMQLDTLVVLHARSVTAYARCFDNFIEATNPRERADAQAEMDFWLAAINATRTETVERIA